MTSSLRTEKQRQTSQILRSSDRHPGSARVGGVVVGAKGICLQSKCCESCFQSKLFWLPPHPLPDAHFWVSKVNELLLLHSIWNWEGRVGVGFRIQSHPVLFELLISRTWEEQFVTPRESRILQIWSLAVSSSAQCTLHLHFHLLTSLLCYVSKRHSCI